MYYRFFPRWLQGALHTFTNIPEDELSVAWRKGIERQQAAGEWDFDVHSMRRRDEWAGGADSGRQASKKPAPPLHSPQGMGHPKN